MENKSTLSNFSTWQKASLGIAASFYAVYKIWLKDPEIVKNLGTAYPIVLMVWTIIMIFAAGMSGWQLMNYLPDPKSIIKKKKDIQGE